MRSPTGTSSASLLPPMKLYLASPLHVGAAGGSPGRNSGAKSNIAGVMMRGSWSRGVHSGAIGLRVRDYLLRRPRSYIFIHILRGLITARLDRKACAGRLPGKPA